MNDFLHRLIHTSALYRQTASFAAAVAVMGLVADHYISAAYGIAALGFLAILLVLLAMRRDLTVVHGLVNSTHDALVARVDSLVEALLQAGVSVPDDPKQPKTAEADDKVDDPNV